VASSIGASPGVHRPGERVCFLAWQRYRSTLGPTGPLPFTMPCRHVPGCGPAPCAPAGYPCQRL